MHPPLSGLHFQIRRLLRRSLVFRLLGSVFLLAVGVAVLTASPTAQAAPLFPTISTQSLPVITVNADGTGDFPTLAEAVAAAPAMATVQLGPGEYELSATLVIDKDLTLEGSEEDLTWVRYDGPGHVAHVRGSHAVTLTRVAFEHAGDQVGNALTVDNGRVLIDSCFFLNAAQGDGVTILQAEGEIRNSIAFGNGMNGFAISSKKPFVLRDNVAQENGTHGFSLVGARGGEMTANSSYQNGQHGFFLYSSQGIRLTLNEAASNQRWGFAVLGSGQADLRQNAASQNVVGFVVGDTAKATVTENYADFNDLAGMLTFGTATADFILNAAMRNTVGILIADRSVAVVQENRCTENFRFGVAIVDEATAQVEKNLCTGNIVGIYVAGEAAPDLVDNVVGDNRLAGLGYDESAGGTATGTQCSANRLGLVVTADAIPQLADTACADNLEADLVDLRVGEDVEGAGEGGEGESAPMVSGWQPQDEPGDPELLPVDQCLALDLEAAYTATKSLPSLRLELEIRLSAGGPEMTLLTQTRQVWAGEDMGHYAYLWDGASASNLFNRPDLLGYSILDLVDTVSASQGLTQILYVGGEMTLRDETTPWTFVPADRATPILAEFKSMNTPLYTSALAEECTLTQATVGGRRVHHYVYAEPNLYEFNQNLGEYTYFMAEAVDRRLDIWLDEETGALLGYELAATQDAVGGENSYLVSLHVTDVDQPLAIALPLARPKLFPDAVPMPEDAQVKVNGQFGMAFTTQLEPEAVLDFYRSTLPDWDEQIITDTLYINGSSVDTFVGGAPGVQPEPTSTSEDASSESGSEVEGEKEIEEVGEEEAGAGLGIVILQFAQGPTALYVTVADPVADAALDSAALEAASSGTSVVLELLGPLPAGWASPGTPAADLSVTPSITETFPLTPTTALAFTTLGESLAGRGDLKEAAAAFASALEMEPDLVPALLGRADALWSIGESDAALVDYDQILALDPDAANGVSAHMGRASIHLDMGEVEQALADAEQAVDLAQDVEPDLAAQAHLLRGIIRYIMADDMTSLADFNQAIALDPSMPGAWLWRARFRLYFGNALTALPDLDRTIALQGENADAYYHRGQAYDELGATDNAITDWGRCIALVPSAWECYRERAGAYIDLDEADLALADLNRAARLNKDDVDIYLMRAEIYLYQGEADKALLDLDEALFVDDQRLDVLARRGQLLADFGEVDAAIEDFRQLLSGATAIGNLYYADIAQSALDLLGQP